MGRHPALKEAASRAICSLVGPTTVPDQSAAVTSTCFRRVVHLPGGIQLRRASSPPHTRLRTPTPDPALRCASTPALPTPGAMFLLWSSYWLFSLLFAHVRQQAQAQATRGAGPPPRVSHPWYTWPWWPGPLVEPVCKLLLASLGVLVELWIGHGERRCAGAARGLQHAGARAGGCARGVLMVA